MHQGKGTHDESVDVDAALKVSVLVDRCSWGSSNDGSNSYNMSHGSRRWSVHQRLVTPHPAVPFYHCSSSSKGCSSASIETVWEVESVAATRTTSHSSALPRQRIAVYSGPDCAVQSLHVSLQLPDCALASPPPQTAPPSPSNATTATTTEVTALAWVNFPERQLPVLCCLVNPNTLCLWEIYPSVKSSSSSSSPPLETRTSTSSSPQLMPLPTEGWTIPLPFDCRKITALQSGLLLQRLEDLEDTAAWRQTQLSPPADEEEDLNHTYDGFVLQGPPAWKHRLQTLQSSPLLSSSSQQYKPPFLPNATYPAAAATTTAITSLFTLHHPLEDVLPVKLLTRKETLSPQQSPITDVYEQVLWTGTAEWLCKNTNVSASSCTKKKNNDNANEFNAVVVATEQLMVTYHTLHKRHAVWKLVSAPSQPPPPLLYQRTYHKYKSGRNEAATSDWTDFRTTTTMPDTDLLDLMPLSVKPTSSTTLPLLRTSSLSSSPRVAGTMGVGRVTRDEALAEALGVRRSSPRQSGGATATTKNLHRQQHHQHHRSSNSSRRLPYEPSAGEFSSPPLNATAAVGGGDMMDLSLNNNNATTVVGSHGYVTGSTNSLLHAKIAVTCLYTEDAGVSPTRYDTIFLASNETATGTLILAMVSAASSKLNLYSLLPSPADSKSLTTVQPLTAIPCLSAQPIRVCPTPLCWREAHRQGQQQRQTLSTCVTDIMVLRNNRGRLTLFRANVPAVDCALDGMYYNRSAVDSADSTMVVTGIFDSVHDRFTLQLQNKKSTDEHFTLRCQLNLTLRSAVAEKVLSAIDAAVYATTQSSSRMDETSSSSSSVTRDRLFPIAIKIRADSVRLVQSLSGSRSQGLPVAEDPAFSAVCAVVATIAQYELQNISQLMAKSDAQPQQQTQQTSKSSAWQRLLDSDYHQTYSMDSQILITHEINDISTTSHNAKSASSVMEDTLSSIGSHSIDWLRQNGGKHYLFHRVFDSVHLLYEDSKLLMSCAGHDMVQLVSLLVNLCQPVAALDHRQHTAAQLFLDYYRNDMGDRLFNLNARSVTTKQYYASNKVLDPGFKFTSFLSPPSILSWILATIKNGIRRGLRDGIYDLGDLNVVNAACSKTRSILRIFCLIQKTSDSLNCDADVVLALLEEGFTDVMSIQEDLPLGISLPLLEVLFRCRNQACLTEVPGWTTAACVLVGRPDLGMNLSGEAESTLDSVASRLSRVHNGMASISIDAACDDEAKDGLFSVEKSAAVFFPEDNRVHEAARLLCSSRPIFLRVARAVEVSDHDYERLKQKRLLLLCYRALALPTGRGMLTIGGLCPVPAEPLPLPDLCLKGRIPPTNATLNLDISECPADMQVWPEFHNGVAAGLRLSVDIERAKFGFTITRTWIVYNRPPVTRPPPPQDSGDDANPPAQPQSYSHGGLLLALGLRGHLTALEMSDIYEYLTQGCATTTVGALLGLAANKRGSCDMSVSKILCLHIPSLIPQHFSAIDVASTVQTAAVFGAGLLFQGSSHRMMTEFLINEIGKRPDTDVNTSDREAYTLACGLALGSVNLCLGQTIAGADRKAGLVDLQIEERLIRYIVGGVDNDEEDRTRESNDRFSLPSSLNGNDCERCSTIFESNLINTSVTAPGATLALGLLFMKTNNKTVAAALALPDTHFLLEFVRPDFLGLRVISRALILWEEVEASKEWIDEQVPAVVRTAYRQVGVAAKTTFGIRSPGGKPRKDLDFDKRAVRQIYVHVVSAACFGIGIRFAGTGNADAKAALLERVLELHALREASDPVSAASRPEIPILETCLGCAAISLAMVLAGTGDLEVLKVFKILRWRCDSESQYGIHMIYGMAVGLLFLGGGTCTLGREPADIAALVTAFFPRFPINTLDNQYHLQALRHMYTLAVKRRELRAIDVDTRENVDVTVEVSSGTILPTQLFKVPCLLRNSESPLETLRVVSENYYPLKFVMSQRSGSCVFYVKRRNSQLTNTPNLALLRRLAGAARQTAGYMVQSSTDNQFLAAFSHYLSESSPRFRRKGSLSTGSDFLSRALCRCGTVDTEEALFVYMALRRGIEDLQRADSSAAVSFVWNMRLIRTYYNERKHLTGLPDYAKPILDTDLLLPYLQDLTDRALSLQLDDAPRYAFLLYG